MITIYKFFLIVIDIFEIVIYIISENSNTMVNSTKKDIVKIPVERTVANELKRQVDIGETYTIAIKRLLDKNK